jgi:exopolyphosphatase/guanosine-5'-triphosphate,3'-diphosphate pyrophosphatase
MPDRPRSRRVAPAARQLAEVEAFLDQYETEPDHVRHVSRIAVQLFDELCARHGFGRRERHLLECGALLHDVGWFESPDGRAHHKNSYAMIQRHRWRTFSASERLIIALIARYHRRALPDRKHEGYAILGRDGRELVRRLAAILRVADSLDRGHVQRVRGVTIEDHGQTMTLRIEAAHHWKAEQLAVDKKKDLWELVFSCELYCLPA